MAGIDTGGHGGKRATNHEIPLIPFIDFLLCLVMFLLVTAVWSHMARLEADAKVPSPSKDMTETPPKPQKKLHVEIKADQFYVYWTLGASSAPITSFNVPRNDSASSSGKNGDLLYKELGKKLEETWKEQGQHKEKADRKFDMAVIHAPNDTEFRVITAVIDALNTPQRDDPEAKGKEKVPAIHSSFAL